MLATSNLHFGRNDPVFESSTFYELASQRTNKTIIKLESHYAANRLLLNFYFKTCTFLEIFSTELQKKNKALNLIQAVRPTPPP